MTLEKQSSECKPIFKEYLDIAVPDTDRKNFIADVIKSNHPFQKNEESPGLNTQARAVSAFRSPTNLPLPCSKIVGLPLQRSLRSQKES